MSLIEKIDALEKHLVKNNSYFEGAEWLFGKAREAILSEQKENGSFKQYFMELYGQGLEVTNWHLNGDTEPLDNFIDSALETEAEDKPLTIGDKIRESNESLTEYIIELLKENEEYHHSLDAQEWNTYLNQPYTDTTN